MNFRLMVVIALLISIFCILDHAYAANGDLVVNGNLKVGSGITFPDNTTQSTAAPGNALVCDRIVTGSPVTSVTCPDLDGNADGGYEFEFIMMNTSYFIGATGLRLYYNEDLDKANYQVTYHSTDGVTHGYNRTGGEAYISGTRIPPSGWWHANGHITVAPDGRVSTRLLSGNSQNWEEDVWQFKTGIVANLTRIDIVANAPYGIGVNSRFRLWKKK